MTDSLARLCAAGVSVWLDDLRRERLTSGSLAALGGTSMSPGSRPTRRSSPGPSPAATPTPTKSAICRCARPTLAGHCAN